MPPKEPSSNRRRGKKRKYGGGISSNTAAGDDVRKIPKGLPSILVSCDPSRELKCKREFLEILRHDWDLRMMMMMHTSSDDKNHVRIQQEHDTKLERLTLDQELALLKQENITKTTTEPFVAFETGCKGTILIVCTGCKPIVVGSLSDSNNHGDTKVDGDGSTEAASTTQLHDSETKDTKKATPFWDPVAAVNRITAEMMKPNSSYPDSRYCSKITPLQTVVYADLDKIERVVEQLLQHETTIDIHKGTFAIRVNRRLGSHKALRDEIIAKVGLVVAKVAPKWTVNLKQPDVIVWVEIIKNLAGIAISTSPIVNLTALREQRSKAEDSTLDTGEADK